MCNDPKGTICYRDSIEFAEELKRKGAAWAEDNVQEPRPEGGLVEKPIEPLICGYVKGQEQLQSRKLVRQAVF